MRWTKGSLESLLVVGLIGIVVSCGPSKTEQATGPIVLDEQAPPEALARARQAAEALGTEVIATLFRELEDGDPASAIQVCSVKAQELAAKFSTDGLKIRRISARYRNPADAPDAYESKRLAELQTLKERGQLPEESIQIVEGRDGTKTLRYLKPILVKQPCLMCHGSVYDVDDNVMDTIRAQYPGDQAIDYKVDDLRGAISVVVQL